MAAPQTPYFAFEMAVRLLHDYPWHPPPGLSKADASRGVAIASLYATVEKLLPRPVLMFTAWYCPGLQVLLGTALGGRVGLKATMAAAGWLAATMLVAAEIGVLVVSAFIASVHVPAAGRFSRRQTALR